MVTNNIPGNPVLHKENGMWLYMENFPGQFPIARQSSIPHGDTVLALGNVQEVDGPPPISPRDCRPIGQSEKFSADYTMPYTTRGGWNHPFRPRT